MMVTTLETEGWETSSDHSTHVHIGLDVHLYGVPSPPKIKVDHNIQLESVKFDLTKINIQLWSSFNFVVLNVIVKTLDFNFISESSTLNFVHQHSSLLINIALDTCTFRERWTLNHQVKCWVTKGEPIPPKIKVDHNIQLCSSIL